MLQREREQDAAQNILRKLLLQEVLGQDLTTKTQNYCPSWFVSLGSNHPVFHSLSVSLLVSKVNRLKTQTFLFPVVFKLGVDDRTQWREWGTLIQFPFMILLLERKIPEQKHLCLASSFLMQEVTRVPVSLLQTTGSLLLHSSWQGKRSPSKNRPSSWVVIKQMLSLIKYKEGKSQINRRKKTCTSRSIQMTYDGNLDVGSSSLLLSC